MILRDNERKRSKRKMKIKIKKIIKRKMKIKNKINCRWRRTSGCRQMRSYS